MIAIIDYDAGNIKSVEKALHYLGEETTVTRDPQTLLNAIMVTPQRNPHRTLRTVYSPL